MANFTGTAGNDTYAGTSADDTIHDGGNGNDSLAGADGSDVITVTGDTDNVDGGAGSDRLILSFGPEISSLSTSSFSGSLATGYAGFLDGTSANNTTFSNIEHFTLLFSGAGAVGLTTGDGNDSIVTGVGNDDIRSGGGVDTIDAGAGIDRWGANLSAETADIVIDLNGTSTYLGTGSVTGVEGFNVMVGGAGDDRFTSTAANLVESIIGGDGDDVISLFGLASDTVDGGVGRDRLVETYSGVSMSVSAFSGDLATGYTGFYDGTSSNNVAWAGIEDFSITMLGANLLNARTGDGNDVLTGGDGADTLNSGGGLDTIDGGAGVDRWGADLSAATDDITIDLGAATSTYLGGGSVTNVEAFSTLTTGSGDDRITNTSTTLGETIIAGDGDDVVTMNGSGNDSVGGGEGNDRLVFHAEVDISLGGMAGSLETGYSDFFDGVSTNNLHFSGIENFTVTFDGPEAIELTVGDGQDILLSGSGGDDLIGAGGDDDLNGRGGADSIQAGAGADTVTAGLGVDTVNGGADLDRLVIDYAAATAAITSGAYTPTVGGGWSGSLANSTDASNVIFSAFEDFHIFSGSAADSLVGADGADLLSSGDGADTLDGGAGADTLVGGLGADSLVGGLGLDTADYSALGAAITANLSANTVAAAGGAGTDSISGVENLIGTSLADSLTGDGQANRLDGGDGADTVDGGAGDDTLIGGLGNDTASYASAGAGVTVALADGAQNTGAGSDQLSGFENLTGSGSADTLTGDAGDNALLGAGGEDTLVGGLGNDTLDGGSGAADTADYGGAAASVTVSLGGSSATGGAGSDTLLRIERVIGSGFGDVLTGSGGADTLLGGDGKDTLNGGAGNDSLDGGNARDVVSYFGAAGDVTVSLALSTAQNTGGAGTDTLDDIEDLTGSSHDDVLTGDGSANRILGLAGDDLIKGGGGNDTVDGGDRNDTLAGGAGDDQLNGGRGKNTVTYADAAGGVTVSLAVATAQNTGGDGTDVVLRMRNLVGSAQGDALTGDDRANSLTGGAGNDTLNGGDGKDRLDGGADNDRLLGDLGQDRLNGGDGADTLNGGVRYDLLTGGSGNDTFVFDRVDLVSDRVTDLATGDVVDLSAIDADSTTGGNQAFELVTGFHNEAGEARLNYKAGKNETLLELDMNGDGVADMTITLDGDQRSFTGFVL